MDETKALNRSRMTLLLIAGIPITVILVATWLWYYVVQGKLDLVAVLGTSNSGILVQPPRELDRVNITSATGHPVHYSELEPRWTFLVPGGSQCDSNCEKSLYTTRQIHIALGKEFNRIQRLYLSDTSPAETSLSVAQLSDKRPAPQDFVSYLAAEHRGLKAWQSDDDLFGHLFVEYQQDPTTWYLVDPAGWIMMSYNQSVDYKGVISDLKFLLKNSSE